MERAHGRQRQQRGWPGQPAPSLPGARATPAQPASGGGCLPQPRWAVCRTGAGAHQGQTSREGEKHIWWTAGTTRGGTGHLGLTHTEPQQGRLQTACGQRRVDSNNSQTTPATTSTSSIRQLLGAADTQTAHPATFSTAPAHWAPRTRKRHQQEHRPQRPTESSDPTQHAKGRVTVQGPVKEQQRDGMSHRGGGVQGRLEWLYAVGGGEVPPPGLPLPHQRDPRGRKRNLPIGKSDWAIFGTQKFGSHTPPPPLLIISLWGGGGRGGCCQTTGTPATCRETCRASAGTRGRCGQLKELIGTLKPPLHARLWGRGRGGGGALSYRVMLWTRLVCSGRRGQASMTGVWRGARS